VLISGNKQTETVLTTPLIMSRLDEFVFTGETALALVMLGVSFTLLLSINAFTAWVRRREGLLP
jgi:sulfate transport system permease protein